MSSARCEPAGAIHLSYETRRNSVCRGNSPVSIRQIALDRRTEEAAHRIYEVELLGVKTRWPLVQTSNRPYVRFLPECEH